MLLPHHVLRVVHSSHRSHGLLDQRETPPHQMYCDTRQCHICGQILLRADLVLVKSLGHWCVQTHEVGPPTNATGSEGQSHSSQNRLGPRCPLASPTLYGAKVIRIIKKAKSLISHLIS